MKRLSGRLSEAPSARSGARIPAYSRRWCMRTRLLNFAVCLVLSSGLTLAQAPAEKPKPGPEHKKLGYFVGKWNAEAEMKPGPFMPGGKMTSRDICRSEERRVGKECRSRWSPYH